MPQPSSKLPDESAETPQAPRMRLCLKCQRTFESEWSGERICGRCKGSSEWRRGAFTKPHPASVRR